MVQTLSAIQEPSLSEFRPIGESKRVLPYAVRTGDGIYRAPYLEGINGVEQLIAANPNLKGFIPSSLDMYALYLTLPLENIFWVGTGTLVLRRGENGYADQRVTDPEGRPLRLQKTSIAHHGMHWRTAGPDSIMVTEPGKLLPYTEIDSITKKGRYRVADYDEERGVVTRFNPENKPVAKYNNASAWVNPNLLVVPLVRGGWGGDVREGLFGSGLDWGAGGPYWGFPLGSLATDKQVVAEELAEFRKRLAEMPGYSKQLDNGLVALQKELESE